MKSTQRKSFADLAGPHGRAGVDRLLLVFALVSLFIITASQGRASSSSLQATTQEPLPGKEIEAIAQIGGGIHTLLPQGDTIFAGAGVAILTVDASSPNRPVVMGSSESFTDTVRQLAFANGHLFAAVGSSGLIALDVTLPSQPQVVSRTWAGRAEAVAVSGHHAYVVDGAYGLRVFDIANAVAPVLVGQTPTMRQDAPALMIMGNRLFIARGYSGMEIVNITNPGQPQLLERRQPGNAINDFVVVGDAFYAGGAGAQWKIFRLVNGQTVIEAGQFENGFNAGAVVGSTLFAAEWYRVTIYNVTNPIAPVQIGIFDPSNSKNVDRADRFQHLVAGGNRLFAVNQFDQIRVLDVVNQTNPVPLGLLVRSVGALNSVVAEGDALWTLEDQTLRVHSLRTPATPIEENTFLLTTTSQATTMVKDGPLIYIAGFNGVTIVDVSNRRAPQLVGATGIGAVAYGLALTTGLAIVPSYQSCNIFDVGAPATPTQVGQFDCNNTGAAIAAYRTHVYHRDAADALRIIDLANPAAPTQVGWLPFDRPVHDVAVVDSRLLVAAGPALYIMDLTNPAAPVEVGRYTGSGGNLFRIAGVDNSIVYVVDTANVMQALSIADPAHPRLAGAITVTPPAVKMAVAGAYGYAATTAATLTTFWLGNRISQELDAQTQSFAPTQDILYTFGPDAFPSLPGESTPLEFTHREPYPGSLPAPNGMIAVTPAAQLHVRRLTDDHSAPPNGPVTVTVQVTELTMNNVVSTSLAFYGWSGAEWQPVPSIYDPVAQQVAAQIAPLAPWQLLATGVHRIHLPIVARPAPDVRITMVEATQAIQTPDNGVALVAGKPTLLRVFAATSDSQPENNLTLTVVASRDGQPLAASPLTVGPWAVFPNPARGEYNHSFNVLLPPGWLTGVIDLSLAVNSKKPDTDPTNNTLATSLSFRYVPPLDLRLTPIEYVDTATGVTYPALTTEAVSDFVLRTYPIGRLDVSLRAPLTFRGNLKQLSEVVRLLGMIEALKKSDGAPAAQVYYGMLPGGGYGAAAGGIGYLDRRVSLGFNDGSIAAHEIGHNFGRRHAPCGNVAGADPNYPYPNASIGQYGFDTGTLLLQSPDVARDIMSYCGPKWFSDYTYRALMEDQVRRASLTGATTGQGLLIRALLDESGAATILPVYALDGALLEDEEPGDYAVVLLASDGQILGEYPATVAEAEDDGVRVRAITRLIPQPDADVAAIQIRRDGLVLAERRLSGIPVSAAALTLEQSENELALRWESGGAPVLVRYSHDGGVTWTTLAVDAQESLLTIDPAQLPGGSGFFQLIPADALANGVAVAASGSIVLSDKPPRAWITGPTETAAGESMILFGHGDDLEDGVLGELTWTVDGQAAEADQLLQLTNLTPGDHLVTLEVVDSSGQAAVAERWVKIKE